MIRKKMLPLAVFLLLSLTIPLFVTVFENLTSFMVIPVRREKVYPPYIPETGSATYKIVNAPFFNVSPTSPVLFWRAVTYDNYDGFKWETTTISSTAQPQQNPGNATRIFKIELSSTAEENFLPTPSPTSIVLNFTISPNMDHTMFFDETASIYKVQRTQSAEPVKITYWATWDFFNIWKETITLSNISENIRETYLQLPRGLPVEVKRFAEGLRNSSLGVLDQIIKDVEYFQSNFELDYSYYTNKTERSVERDWVLTFLNQKKGISIDAATALTITLRHQGIPARLCIGFKPRNITNDRVLYYTSGAHALTEAYLPPYGWVQFDVALKIPEGENYELIIQESSKRPSVFSLFYYLRTLTSDTLIRTEKNEIKGEIVTNMRDQISTYITISLDDQEIAIVQTEASGFFSYPFYPPSTEELGKHTITFNVIRRNLTLTQQVKIVERTYLKTTVTATELLGNPLSLDVQLYDAQGIPLKGQRVTCENYGLSWETNSEGVIEFSIDQASTILPKNILYVTSFNGSDQYLGAKTSMQISNTPNPLTFILIFFGLFYASLKENLAMKSSTKSFRKKGRVLGKSQVFLEGGVKNAKDSPLKICFPEIEDSLPIVWGIHDKLLIECALEQDKTVAPSRKIVVYVNDIVAFESEVNGNGYFAFTYSFERTGGQKITALLSDDPRKPLDVAETELRIVDYREEIIRLYKKFLEGLSQSEVSVKNSMTAREIEKTLYEAGILSSKEAGITECFEEAEYSHHPIFRVSYKKILLGLKELNANVE